MGDNFSVGAKLGITLVVLCFTIAITMSVVRVAISILDTASVDQVPVASEVVSQEPLRPEEVITSLKNFSTALFKVAVVGAGLFIVGAVLFIANLCTHITDRISNWFCSVRKVGIHGRWDYAAGELDMDFDTLYTLFSENPEKYIVGSHASLCTPVILYNSTWHNTTENIFVSVDSISVQERCVQIHLTYKDQRRLFKLLKQSIFDEEYRFVMSERAKMIECNSYTALAALEMRKDIAKVINKQNEQNVRTAAQCLEIVDRITQESVN